MPFNFKRLEIPEVVLVEARSFSDDRGFFLESFKESDFVSNGIDVKFAQDNVSHSIKNVLRGLATMKFLKDVTTVTWEGKNLKAFDAYKFDW